MHETTCKPQARRSLQQPKTAFGFDLGLEFEDNVVVRRPCQRETANHQRRANICQVRCIHGSSHCFLPLVHVYVARDIRKTGNADRFAELVQAVEQLRPIASDMGNANRVDNANIRSTPLQRLQRPYMSAGRNHAAEEVSVLCPVDKEALESEHARHRIGRIDRRHHAAIAIGFPILTGENRARIMKAIAARRSIMRCSDESQPVTKGMREGIAAGLTEHQICPRPGTHIIIRPREVQLQAGVARNGGSPGFCGLSRLWIIIHGQSHKHDESRPYRLPADNLVIQYSD